MHVSIWVPCCDGNPILQSTRNDEKRVSHRAGIVFVRAKETIPSMVSAYLRDFQTFLYLESTFISLTFLLDCVVPCLFSLLSHITCSWGDGRVNRTMDQIVTFLVRILAAVQNRIKLQKIHETWRSRV